MLVAGCSDCGKLGALSETPALSRANGLEYRETDPYIVRTPLGPPIYDAVVLGSAVYLGRWMKPAKEFVARGWAAGIAQALRPAAAG